MLFEKHLTDKAAEVLRIATERHLRIATAESCTCLLYTSPSPRDLSTSRMPSSA